MITLEITRSIIDRILYVIFKKIHSDLNWTKSIVISSENCSYVYATLDSPNLKNEKELIYPVSS